MGKQNCCVATLNFLPTLFTSLNGDIFHSEVPSNKRKNIKLVFSNSPTLNCQFLERVPSTLTMFLVLCFFEYDNSWLGDLMKADYYWIWLKWVQISKRITNALSSASFGLKEIPWRIFLMGKRMFVLFGNDIHRKRIEDRILFYFIYTLESLSVVYYFLNHFPLKEQNIFLVRKSSWKEYLYRICFVPWRFDVM